jgi:hypothetical protein
MHEDIAYSALFKDAVLSGACWVLNSTDFYNARVEFYRSIPRAEAGGRELPSDLPKPILYLEQPDLCVDFIPDYQGITAVSRRMREAMALPDWAASWVPIVIDDRSAAEAADMGYQHLHIRASAQAFDLERSIYKGEWRPSAKDGTPFLDFDHFGIQRFEIVEGFEPPADLFNDTIEPLPNLTTDALAIRVLTAGCANVVFEHLSSFYGQDLGGRGKLLRSITSHTGLDLQFGDNAGRYRRLPFDPENREPTIAAVERILSKGR